MRLQSTPESLTHTRLTIEVRPPSGSGASGIACGGWRPQAWCLFGVATGHVLRGNAAGTLAQNPELPTFSMHVDVYYSVNSEPQQASITLLPRS